MTKAKQAKSTGRLQGELKKRRPFDSLTEEALLNLLRTASRLQLQIDRLFTQFGLTSTQYNILRILRGQGTPLPMLEIADRLIAMVPGITGLVDRLEKAQLVQRERCQKDRRVVYVAATEKALKLLAQIDAPLRRLHESIMRPLDQREQRQLVQFMERLRAVAGEASDADDSGQGEADAG
ncbi:MAG: MarR family transcriptional regulator [Pirellulales bacterium]